MKILIVGDIHLSDRPPSSRTESYKEDIFAKLQWISTQSGHEYMVLLGDVFHSKVSMRTSHALVKRLLAWINDLNVEKVFIVPGNHDLHGGNVASLAGQPLGVLEEHPKVSIVGWDFCIGSGRTQLTCLAIPGSELSEIELPGYDGRYPSYDIAFYHQAIAGPSKSFPFPHLRAQDLYERGFASVHIFGHYHVAVPEYELGKTKFIGAGAISRGSSHDSDFYRRPIVISFDFDSWTFTPKEVPCRPPEEVYRVKEIQRRKDKKIDSEQFIEQIRTARLSSLSTETALIRLESMDLDPAVKTRAKELLERA